MLWMFSQISVLNWDDFGKLAAKEMICALEIAALIKPSALVSEEEPVGDTDLCVLYVSTSSRCFKCLTSGCLSTQGFFWGLAKGRDLEVFLSAHEVFLEGMLKFE